jgi:hypothetical protein
MITSVFSPGEWTDICPHPDGYAQVTLEQPGVAVAKVNGHEVWRQPVGWGLGLRITVVGRNIIAAHQRQSDGECRVFDGIAHFGRGPAFGQNPVAWDGSTLLIMRSPTSHDTFDFVTGANLTYSNPATSQGFFDPAGGRFWTDDAFTAIPGMTLGFTRGALSLGQSQTALQLRLRYNGEYAVAYDGLAFEPRLVQRDANNWVGCARTDRGALTLFLTPPFVAEQPAPPTPTPVPTPTPEPPNVAVQDVPNYSANLRDIAARNPVAFRNAHGDYENQGRPGFLTEEQANEFIRIAAYELYVLDRRIGLNGKRATHTLSQDALCFRHDDGRESVIDVINGAGGANPSIGWNVVGHYRNAGDGQRWIQPQPVSTSTPNPTPGPAPIPAPTPTPTPMPTLVDLTPILTELQALRQALADHDNNELNRYNNTADLLKLISQQLAQR